MRYSILFFIFLFLPTFVGATELPTCKWGADPVNKNRQISEGEEVQVAPPGTIFRMQTARNKKGVVCKSKNQQPVVVDSATGFAKWVLKCGNPILNEIQFRGSRNEAQLVDLSEVDSYLLTRKAPEYRIISVHACGPGTVCWARAQQFRVNLNLGASASVHKEFGKWKGYRPDNYNLSNTQNQDQNQQQEARGGDGGSGGQGGLGGTGTGGENLAISASESAAVAAASSGGGANPDPPLVGGPVDPDNPSSGGGNGYNPNNP